MLCSLNNILNFLFNEVLYMLLKIFFKNNIYLNNKNIYTIDMI